MKICVFFIRRINIRESFREVVFFLGWERERKDERKGVEILKLMGRI